MAKPVEAKLDTTSKPTPASSNIVGVDINSSTKLLDSDLKIENPMRGLRNSYRALGDQHSRNASYNYSMFARAMRQAFLNPNPRPLNFFASNVFFSIFYQ